MNLCSRKILIHGIVQGVGFRPFTLRLARKLLLCGTVRNTSFGVEIVVEGNCENVESFIKEIGVSAPVMARIEKIEVEEIGPKGYSSFDIIPAFEGASDTLVSPDLAICEACEKDILNSADRRFGYEFTNCTDCGPRFSIIQRVPYDRPNTVMSDFEMCSACKEEYENPLNRRFHAQPVACLDCGPQLAFYNSNSEASDSPVRSFCEYISAGKTVAVKGLGGYHLACDALNEAAVIRLRERKKRCAKPLAVMMNSIQTVRKYCFVSPQEEQMLKSPERPIVLLKKKQGRDVAPSVAPGNIRLGVMLPYTPLHVMLMKHFECLVMTSCNVSDLPMVFEDDEAFRLLGTLSDAVLTHNRRILRRVDDSVVMFVNGRMRMIRRARGFAPEPLTIPDCRMNIVACGPQQKNTFCSVKGNYAFISSHIGDMDSFEARQSFESEMISFNSLFGIAPAEAVCDMHPDYCTTRFAEKSGLPVTYIQHHHAHFASALAEHGIFDENCLGIIFDGTGYGTDGTVWGGEFLYGSAAESIRVGHFENFSLPGGDKAVLNPLRTAAVLVLNYCPESFEKIFGPEAEELSTICDIAKKGINSPLTSSLGRLFDAVSAMCGVQTVAAYEGSPAVMLEQCSDFTSEGEYCFEIVENDGVTVSFNNVVRQICSDVVNGVPSGTVSARFHRGIVSAVKDCVITLRRKYCFDSVALSGGCFQNAFLLENIENMLISLGLNVYSNERVPANDGGISFGQAAAFSAGMR